MVNVTDNRKCTGCTLCERICPKQAISFSIGENGFLYPVINNNCINCGLCNLKCPSNSESNLLFNSEKQSYYACWSTNKKNRKSSTSGGVFYELCVQIISNGGVVYGCQLENEKVRHCRINSIEDIFKIKKSKYVQSYLDDVFLQIIEDLNNNLTVLFSGTPCQVNSLKLLLDIKKIPTDRLFLVDVVCHGVPSQKMFSEYCREISKDSIENYEFRNKNTKYSWTYNQVVASSKNVKYQNLTIYDPYFRLFNAGYSLRNSCHNCSFASIKRVGDITLGDFWGYRPKKAKMNNFYDGVSLVVVNSNRGKSLFDKALTNLLFCEYSQSEAISGNLTFKESFKELDDSTSFWEDYNSGKYTLDFLANKYLGKPIKPDSKFFIKMFLKSKFYFLFKKR